MLRRTAAALVCVVFLTGCGETSFVGRRYDNFTAYYNTFYNARKSFDRGVKSMQQGDQPVGQDRFMAIYPAPERAGGRNDFEDAIKKSADIIRSHSNSKWVDDAVLLIGKSYFYQQNYVSAAQKFREAIALESQISDEARFWLGRALAANGSYLDARDELEGSLRREDLDRRWEPAMKLLLGDVLIRLREWEDAAEMLRDGLSSIRDREAEARGRFLLGQLQESRGAFQAAQQAFAGIQRLQPPYELGFAARLNELRLASRVGGIDRALDDLRRLERDDKHRAKRADIVYVRGLLLQEGGDARAARQTYLDLLYDSEFDVASVRGRVHYALGMLHRDAFEDFVLAAAHFDTAAAALQPPQGTGRGVGTEPLTTLAISDSRQQADVFNTYARVYGDVARMDSLLHLADLPDDEFQAFVQDLRRQLQRDIERRRREEERQRGEAQFADAFGTEAQEPAQQQGASTGTAGFLFHRDPVRVQEGKQAFVRRWGDRPLVPGWRRREAVDSYVREQRENAVADGAVPAQQLTADPDASLPTVDVSAVPRTPAARREMVERRAMARYELGNVLFISMNRADSAAAWYQLVMDEDHDLPVAGRAFYALAELERSRGRTQDANNLYRIVLERYPGSEFEGRVREHLGMEQDVRTDTLALAQSRFDELMAMWRAGRHRAAYSGLIALSLDVTDENFASAALMAASHVGIDWIRQDSLQLTDPLPVDLPDSLLARAGLLHVVDESVGAADAPPDTIGVVLASLDSLAVAPETGPPSADSLLVRPRDLTLPALRSVAVEQLLTRLANTYATSRMAPQARSMLSEIDERRPVPDDSLLVDVADTLAGDTLTASPDPGEATEPPSETGAAPETSPGEPDDAGAEPVQAAYDMPAADVFSLRGTFGLVTEAGGWTLQVGDLPTLESAEQLAADLREEGFRADVRAAAGEEASFRVYVGQFEQRNLAEAALRTNRNLLPDTTAVVAVPEGDSP